MKAYPAAVLLLALAVGGPVSVVSYQDAGTASIEGTIVQAGSNVPIEGARVTAESASQGRTLATTDAYGAFVLTGLTPGPYRLTFAARGYLQQTYGQRIPDGQWTPIEVAAGHAVKDVVARLNRGGAKA